MPKTTLSGWGEVASSQSRMEQSLLLPGWQCWARCTPGHGWSFWLPGHTADLYSTSVKQNSQIPCHWAALLLLIPQPLQSQVCSLPGTESGTCPCSASFSWWLPSFLICQQLSARPVYSQVSTVPPILSADSIVVSIKRKVIVRAFSFFPFRWEALWYEDFFLIKVSRIVDSCHSSLVLINLMWALEDWLTVDSFLKQNYIHN